MKTSKEKIYEFIQKEIYTNNQSCNGIETSKIAKAFSMQRANVSSILNELVKEGKLEKVTTRPVLFRLLSQEEQALDHSCFADLIGYNGSLKNAIQLAKAAILYPQKCLNVLLLSNIGCGTTYFASLMFQYAKESGVLHSDAPYVKINCRHYVKNIEVLDDELFGIHQQYSKFEMAKNGMMFIDNADLLDAKQQSYLLEYIESGKIYSKDKTQCKDFRDVFLVVSCSSKSALYTNLKLPVTIELPKLKDRPLQEHFDLINYFFSIEAMNSDRCIKVTAEAFKALLLHEFMNNVKEMELEIKAACANAYVRVVNDKSSDILVCTNDIKSQIRKSLLKLKDSAIEITALTHANDSVIYDAKKYTQTSKAKKQIDGLYEDIKKQYDVLVERGIDSTCIERVVNTHIDNLFRKYRYYHVVNENFNIEQLAKIVDMKIIQMVSGLLDTYHQDTGKTCKPSVFYGLCLHINSLLNFDFESKRVNSDQIVNIIQEYPKDYAIGVQFAEVLKLELGLELPIEEIVLITMFLIEANESTEESEHPVLLYILHGKGTATSLCEVTNALTQCQNAYGYDLLLDIDCKQALEEIKTMMLNIDNGQGVIVIYDMGSIRTMLDTISEEIDITIRYMNIPITLIGIDVARKCVMEKDIDYVYHKANLDIKKLYHEEKLDDIIITLCHTGEGGAYQLKRYIEKYSKLGMKIVPLSIASKDKLLKEVMSLRKIYHIQCIVGTYDPKLLGIPFIPISKVFENSGENIDLILMFKPVSSHTFNYEEVYRYFEHEFKFVSVTKLKTVLPCIIDEFHTLYGLSDDCCAGLFVHLACLIERLKEGKNIAINQDADKINSMFEEDYQAISNMISRLEKEFKLIVNDSEIATIIMIIKRL